MKTHQKITLLLISVAGSLLLVFALYQQIRQKEFEIFMHSKHDSDLEIITKVLDFKADGYLKTTIDNSAWDDMVNYIATRDLEWAKENLGTSIITFDLSCIGVYDLLGEKIYSVASNESNDVTLTQNQIRLYFSKEKTWHSFVQYDGNLFEVFGAIVVPSFDIHYTTSANGYLIFGKKWDSGYVDKIEQATGFQVEILPKNTYEAANNSDDHETIYLPITDFNGSKLVVLKFSKKSDLRRALNEVKFLPAFGLVFFLMVILVFTILIRKWLTKPLRAITGSLLTRDLKPVDTLLNQQNEFGEIARILKRSYDQNNDLVKEVEVRTKATEKFRALLAAQPDMMFILDHSGVFHEYYAPDEKLLYKKPENFIGRKINEVFPPVLAEKIMSAIGQIGNHENIGSLEYEMDLSYGINYFEARFVGIYNNLILCVVRNITDRKKADAELILAKERAEESDRLKTAFLANMSHEIRTPMNHILGFTDLLDDETLPESDKREFRMIIKNSGEQLLNVINDILDVSKIDSRQVVIHPRIFNLNHFLDEISKTFENFRVRTGNPPIVLLVEKPLDDIHAMVNTDDLRLRQVLNNLVGNALKFTMQGHVKFGYQVADDKIIFFVEDTGQGIAPEKQKWIFDRFRQVEETYTRSFGGAGLGLSICQGLVELLGGHIWLNSIEGKGSTFFFSLPCKPLSVIKTAIPEKQVVKNICDYTGKTILIAEDVSENIELMKWMLKKENINLLFAEDGLQAVELCRTNESIELVMMDIQMPEMNGYDATLEIRTFKKDLPIVAMTAFVNAEDKQRCFQVGCNDVIYKPVSKNGLLTILNKYLLAK